MSSILDREPILAELADLRDRVCELEEEVRLLKAYHNTQVVSPPEWKLQPGDTRVLAALCQANGGTVSVESLLSHTTVMGGGNSLNLIGSRVCNIRKKLKPFGVRIITTCREGYSLAPESVPIVRAALAVPPAVPLAA